MTVIQVLPLLVEYSIRKMPEVPPWLMVMFWVEQPIQFWPPLGAATVTWGARVKTALLTSLLAGATASLTRTRAVVLGLSGMVQGKDPVAFGVELTMVVQVAPLSVEYSSLTLAPVKKELTQVMFCTVPAYQVSPPLGAMSRGAAGPMVKTASL